MRLPFLSARKAGSSKRSNDLLGLMICLAAILHTTVIFGVGFAPEDKHISQVLDVTIASFKDDEAPEKADFLAQENQQGSGTADKKLAPKTTTVADFQDSQVNPTATPVPTLQEQTQTVDTVQSVLITKADKEKEKSQKTEKDKEKESQDQQSSEPMELNDQIASLEALIAKKAEIYAKRPRVLQITSSATKKDKGALYQDNWRKIIENVGNLNYPKEASNQKIYGSLRLLVAIKKDGQLEKVEVLASSGKPVLDRAAIRIVHMAAPYPPFPKELSDVDTIEIIRTWRFDRSDRISTDEQ